MTARAEIEAALAESNAHGWAHVAVPKEALLDLLAELREREELIAELEAAIERERNERGVESGRAMSVVAGLQEAIVELTLSGAAEGEIAARKRVAAQQRMDDAHTARTRGES